MRIDTLLYTKLKLKPKDTYQNANTAGNQQTTQKTAQRNSSQPSMPASSRRCNSWPVSSWGRLSLDQASKLTHIFDISRASGLSRRPLIFFDLVLITTTISVHRQRQI